MLAEAGRRRRQGWRDSNSSDDDESSDRPSPTPTISTQTSDDDIQQDATRITTTLSDREMLERARAAHCNEDFASLAAGPEANGPWKRVTAADRFVVFRRQVTASNNDTRPNGLEVICAGRLDASLEEVSSILRSNSEAEHNAAMTALYAKSSIFGSYDREVSCSGNQEQHEAEDDDNSEQLAVKTNSFARSTMLRHNEQ